MTTTKRTARRAGRAAQIARIAAFHAAAQAHVARGTCPDCGTKLYRNLALAGWWQCGRVGAVGFQRVAGQPCNFQIFTE